jgi:hypothetical protein
VQEARDGVMYNKYNTGPKYTTATIICPSWSVIGEIKEIRDDFKKLWADQEFGNDNYYMSTSAKDMEEKSEFWDDYPNIRKFVLDEGIEGPILLHYWW